jgi:hypothetical protein
MVWHRVGSAAGRKACAGSSPALSVPTLYDLNLEIEYQAPASVQSCTREPRQDRKVATVATFRCAADSTGACPILRRGSFLIRAIPSPASLRRRFEFRLGRR